MKFILFLFISPYPSMPTDFSCFFFPPLFYSRHFFTLLVFQPPFLVCIYLYSGNFISCTRHLSLATIQNHPLLPPLSVSTFCNKKNTENYNIIYIFLCSIWFEINFYCSLEGWWQWQSKHIFISLYIVYCVCVC